MLFTAIHDKDPRFKSPRVRVYCNKLSARRHRGTLLTCSLVDIHKLLQSEAWARTCWNNKNGLILSPQFIEIKAVFGTSFLDSGSIFNSRNESNRLGKHHYDDSARYMTWLSCTVESGKKCAALRASFRTPRLIAMSLYTKELFAKLSIKLIAYQKQIWKPISSRWNKDYRDRPMP